MRVAGVDGTKGGWVGMVFSDGRIVADHLLQPLNTEFHELSNVEVIAIDVPIGFGPRAADVAARRYLRGASSTVFPTPSREALEVPFGPGLGVSAQAHALGPRIVHITELARRDERFHEVHPEVSFRAMNGGRALAHRKKSAGGALERIALLEQQGIELPQLGTSATVPLDDVLDAAAATWSAQRIARGLASTLPETPEVVDGYRVAIWY